MSGIKRLKSSIRFRKGSQVEVFQSGNWRPAKVICGNGRTYTVRYHCCSSSTNKIINEEKVPRMVLRPPPPIKEKADKWAPGDLAEALLHGSWRLVMVTGLSYGNEYYFISPSGQRRELAVKLANLRRRRMWQNGKWITIKEEHENLKNSKKQRLSKVACGDTSKKLHQKNMNVSSSTISSTGSCSTSVRPYQYQTSWYAEDDAISSYMPMKQARLSKVEKRDQEMERGT